MTDLDLIEDRFRRAAELHGPRPFFGYVRETIAMMRHLDSTPPDIATARLRAELYAGLETYIEALERPDPTR